MQKTQRTIEKVPQATVQKAKVRQAEFFFDSEISRIVQEDDKYYYFTIQGNARQQVTVKVEKEAGI